MKHCQFLLLLLAGTVSRAFPATYTVTNTLDAGAGSLRAAITSANGAAGPHLINFNIPSAGPHTITVATVLPTLNRAITIDATTQPGYTSTPIVRLTRSAGTYGGLNIAAADCAVYGLEIFGFGMWGVQVTSDAADAFRIGAPNKGNVIRGNSYYGISIMGGDNGYIQNNWVGVFSDGVTASPNLYQGIMIGDGNSCFSTSPSNNNTVSGNIVSTNAYDGIKVYASNNNIISNNVVGAAANTGCTDRSNLYYGIRLGCSSQGNRINNNIITYNDYGAINLEDGGTDFNQISQNTIFCNNGAAIGMAAGANSSYAAPVISAANGSGCSGTSPANAIVEVFIDDACAGASGQTYVGSTTASAGGAWTFSGALFGSVVATATHPSLFDTSPFSNVRATGVAGSPSSSCAILSMLRSPLQAEWRGDHVLLSWQVEDAAAHTGYHMLRLDGGAWREVGHVGSEQGQAGAFSFADASMGAGMNYYRFRALDQDGAVAYSNVVGVFAGSTAAYALFPQPVAAGAELHCQVPENGVYGVEVVDVAGRVVVRAEHAVMGEVLSVPLPATMQPGCYLLRIVDGSGRPASMRILVD